MATGPPPKSELDILKDNIRCVLLPYKEDCSLKQFAKDYKSEVAPHLPNPGDFGYNTLIDLLYSLRDTVYVREQYGEYYLRAVATKETQHIKKLVSRQKSAVNKSRRFPSYPILASRRTGYLSQYNPSCNKSVQRRTAPNPAPRYNPNYNAYTSSQYNTGHMSSRSNITHAQSMSSSHPVGSSSRQNTFVPQKFSSSIQEDPIIYYRQTNTNNQNNINHSQSVYSQPNRSEGSLQPHQNNFPSRPPGNDSFSQRSKNALPINQFAATNRNEASRPLYSWTNQLTEPKYHIGDENYNTSKRSNTCPSPQTLPLKSSDPTTHELSRKKAHLDTQAASRLTNTSPKPPMVSETNRGFFPPTNNFSNPPIASVPPTAQGDSRPFIDPNPRNGGSYAHSLPPRGIVNETLKSAVSASNIATSVPPTKHYSPTINERVKKFIRCYPNGLDITELPSNFAKVHNYTLSYEKYNSSLPDFLNNIPGITIRKVNNQTIVYYEEDEKAQSPVPSNRSAHDNPDPKHAFISDWVTGQNKITHDVNINESITFEPPESRTSSRLSNSTSEPVYTRGVSEYVREIVKSILKDFPHGIRATQFPSKFQEKSGKPIDLHLRQSGHPNLQTFLSAMPDILKYEPLTKRDFLILPLSADESVVSSELHSNVIKFVSSRLETLLLAAGKEGVPLDQLQSLYQLNVKLPLPLEEIGCDNFENFIHIFKSFMPLTLETNKEGVKVVILAQKEEVAAPQVNRRLSQHEETLRLPQPVEELRPRTPANTCIPFDAVPPNAQYAVRKLSDDLLEGKYFLAYVSSALNPDRIFIQVIDEQLAEMERIYKEMDNFYTNETVEFYKMKPEHIKIGAVCAAFYPEERRWYRAMIIGVESADEVRVNYLDYATILNISVEDLRYLKKDFFECPLQAILTKLAYVKPKHGNQWPQSVQRVILEFTSNKQISAKVGKVDAEGIPHLMLCDVNVESQPFLNDFLIDNKYADVNVVPVREIESPASSISDELNANIEKVLRLCRRTMEDAHRQAPHLKDIFIDVNAYMGALEKHLIAMKQCFSLDPNSEEHRARTAEREKYLRKFFKQFLIPLPTFPERYVKRVHFTHEWVFHIIKANECPFVSAGDVSKLLWRNKDDVEYVVNQLEIKGITVPSLSLCETSDNAELFQQIKRFQVYGHRIIDGKSYILLYPLKNLMYLLNLFGHPSEYLRQDVLEETRTFNPQQSYWKVIIPYNFPAEGEVRPDTKEIEKSKVLGHLCLTELNELKKKFGQKRKQLFVSTDENRTNKLEELNKLSIRINCEMRKITIICEQFITPLHMDLCS